METTIGKEDLDDLDRLREKLMIPQASWDVEGLENLLKLNTRLVGQRSLLHKGWRETKDVGNLEAGRMAYNIRSIDKVIKSRKYIFATAQQQEAIAVGRPGGIARHVTVTGRAGTGKTVVLLGLIKEHMKQPKEFEQPVKRLLVLTSYRNYPKRDKDRQAYRIAMTTSPVSHEMCFSKQARKSADHF